MYIYHHWQGLKRKHEKIVIGLGNFDGVHLGHQKLISEIRLLSKEIGGTPAVLTFHPHPLAVLAPDSCPPMILSQEAKQRLLEKLGVAVLLLVPFDLEFARLAPDDFMHLVLNEGLGVSGVVVGYNFTFGYRGQGTPELLEEQSARHNYRIKVVAPVVVDGQVVSSTLLRELISQGKVTEAAKFLGYYPFVEGPVVTGARRGGGLGFPTANLDLNKKLLVPANGVYAVQVHVDGETYLGVANIGVKPTFQGQIRNIEVHLLDFYQDLYGKNIRVKFTRRLRGERRFNTTSDLVKQIEQDIIQTRLAVDRQ